MIETRVNEQKGANISFPKLMIGKVDGIIIMAINQRNTDIEGIVIHDPKDKYPAYSHSNIWNVMAFEDFHGSITLSNQPDEKEVDFTSYEHEIKHGDGDPLDAREQYGTEDFYSK